jgi:hypothetical protein
MSVADTNACVLLLASQAITVKEVGELQSALCERRRYFMINIFLLGATKFGHKGLK